MWKSIFISCTLAALEIPRKVHFSTSQSWNVSKIGRKSQATWALNTHQTMEVEGKKVINSLKQQQQHSVSWSKHANYIFAEKKYGNQLDGVRRHSNKYNCTQKFVCTMFKELANISYKIEKCVCVYVCFEVLQISSFSVFHHILSARSASSFILFYLKKWRFSWYSTRRFVIIHCHHNHNHHHHHHYHFVSNFQYYFI